MFCHLVPADTKSTLTLTLELGQKHARSKEKKTVLWFPLVFWESVLLFGYCVLSLVNHLLLDFLRWFQKTLKKISRWVWHSTLMEVSWPRRRAGSLLSHRFQGQKSGHRRWPVSSLAAMERKQHRAGEVVLSVYFPRKIDCNSKLNSIHEYLITWLGESPGLILTAWVPSHRGPLIKLMAVTILVSQTTDLD